MRVLLVGTLPPPGGVDARRFAREAARRSALGDSVETLSGDPLSISHRSATLGGRHLARQLRARSGEFDAVELRLEASLGLTPRSVGKLISALGRYQHVTLFLDSPIPFRGGGAEVLLRLWAAADTIVGASEAEAGAVASLHGGPDKIVVPPEPSDTATPTPAWPESVWPSLQEAVLHVIRLRARASANRSPAAASMLITASERVRPSLKGSSVWLVKRVIGKSRGAITKVLRPTPRNAR